MNELVKFDGLKGEITVFVAPTKEIVVSDAQTNAVALDTLKQIKGYSKRIEETRKELIAPHNDFVKQVNAYAREIEAPLVDAETCIKRTMQAFAHAEERRRFEERKRLDQERLEAEQKAREERKRVEEEAAKKREAVAVFGAKPDDQALEAEKARLDREHKERELKAEADRKALEASRPKNTRKIWKFEITNAAVVPIAFKIVDERKVREAVDRGIREIPGVRIFEETIVVAR